MKKQIWLLMFVFYSCFSFGHSGDEVQGHYMMIKTKQGNIFKGVLISFSDSSLFVFPDKRKDLKKNKFKTVEFIYYEIDEINIRQKGRIKSGMALGSAVGAIPIISLTTTEHSGTNSVAAASLMVPVGAIVGGIVAAKSSSRYWVNAKKELFQNFIRQVFN